MRKPSKSRKSSGGKKPRKFAKKPVAKKTLAKKSCREKSRVRKSVTAKIPPVENPALPGRRPPLPVPPLPGEGKRGPDGYLGYLLRQAQAAARLTLERALADIDVTPAQFVVLTMLKAYPGLSGADLARVALLTPQTVGLIIRNLERSGAIRKTPHPVHGRVLQWGLTRRGEARLNGCRRHVRTVEKRLAAGLTAKTSITVRRWLAGVAREFG